MIDQLVWVIAAHAVGALAACLFMVLGRSLHGRLARAATFHFFVGVGTAVLGTGHMVAVIVNCLSRPDSLESESVLSIAQGLAITLPGLLIILSVPGIATGQCDGCRTVAASDLWLAGFFALSVSPLALLPAAGLILLLWLPTPWAPAGLATTLRRIVRA